MDYIKIRIKQAESRWYHSIFGILPFSLLDGKWKNYIRIEEVTEEKGGLKGLLQVLHIPEQLYTRIDRNQVYDYVKHSVNAHGVMRGDVWLADDFLSASNNVDGRERAEQILFMISPLVRSVQVLKGLKEKLLHIVVIDGGTGLTEYMIRSLYQERNYLSLITQRAPEFESLMEEIYEETGLVIRCLPEPVDAPVSGQIIVDLRQEDAEYNQHYEPNSVVIPVFRQDRRVRTDMEVLRSFDISVGKIAIEISYFEYFRTMKNIHLTSEMQGSYDADRMQYLDGLRKEYDFRIRRLNLVHGSDV